MSTVGLIRNNAQNLLINGNFDIWQRGTSFVAAVNNTYSADRFVYNKSGAMVHTLTRDTDVPTIAESGILSNYSLRFNLTTPDTSIGVGDSCRLQQCIEGYNWAQIAGKAFTLSFWVKATLPGIYCVNFRNAGTSDRTYVAEYTINAANTWEKKTITVSASPSSGTWDYTTGIGLRVEWVLAAGSDAYTTADAWQTGNFRCTSNQINGVNTGATNFRLAQVQVNAGEAAGKFSLAGGTFGAELLLCQRYFEQITGDSLSTPLGYGWQASASVVEAMFNYAVPKRATPTLTDLGGSGQWSVAPASQFVSGALTFFNASNTKTGVQATRPSAAGTTNVPGVIYHRSSSAIINVDAEL